ncbi:hypothetical protein L3X38_010949 [Prunus dulcis]|uniref:Uncharacterized protein n=1 Tax=Prunus dulcis TaxID=3755 RepID=A0AAD4ZF84_PRUDU|nr:hypothetical protein L3X38_010949 [Prunus dulcis]
MTLMNFAAITGLRVGGNRLTYNLDIYKNKNKVMKLFGKPIADLLAGEKSVVWACEYLKPFALSRPSGTVNTWPRTLRWVGAKSKRDLQHHLKHFRVMKRHLTNDQGTNESDIPEEVKNSVPATYKRILLKGPAGSAWFWGSESQCKV